MYCIVVLYKYILAKIISKNNVSCHVFGEMATQAHAF